MYRAWNFKRKLFRLALVSASVFFVSAQSVHATALLATTFAITAPTSIVGTIRQVRTDPSDGKVYVFGSATGTLGVITADGLSFSSVNYDAPLPVTSGSGMVISQGKIFIVASGALNALYRYDLSGTTAVFVASTSLAAGTSAITFGSTSTVYASKGTAAYTFDTNLMRTIPTSTLSFSASRLAYGGGQLFYLSTSGRFVRTNLDGVSDITIATGGPTTNARGLAVAHDGSALYVASTTALAKMSATNGVILWSKAISNLASIDVATSTGSITTIDSNGVVSMYNPINPVSSISSSASSTNAILNWTTGVSDSDFSGVTIRRSTASYPLGVTDGDAVTSSVMSTAYTDSSLSNGTTYYYSLFNATIDGYYSTGATTSVTINLPPEAPVLTTAATSSQIDLSWTVPAGTASFALRRSTSGFPTSPTDSTAVTTTNSAVTSFTQTNLPDGTYYYSIFAIDNGNNYSAAGTSSARTDTTPPAAPNNFTSVANDSTINLSWSNPVDSDFASSTLRRSTTMHPTSISDGVLVTSTIATNFADLSLNNGTYYYSVFAIDTNGNTSVRATSSAAIDTRYVPPASPGGTYVTIMPSAATPTPAFFFAPLVLSEQRATNTLKETILQHTVSPTTTNVEQLLVIPSVLATAATSTKTFLFTRTLRQGSTGADVKTLQKFLNTHGFIIAARDAGSLGNETTFYGPATAKAVKKFQENHKDTILKPFNLEQGTGIFGVATLTFVNGMK